MTALFALYARNHTFLSVLLRNGDRWGRASHAALATLDGTVLEATWRHGVVETPLDEFKARYTRCWMERIECPRPDDGIKWARSQLGAPYDWKAIAGNLFRESWQDPGAWQCAEFVEMAIAQAGRARFREATWRISPNNSAMVI